MVASPDLDWRALRLALGLSQMVLGSRVVLMDKSSIQRLEAGTMRASPRTLELLRGWVRRHPEARARIVDSQLVWPWPGDLDARS